MSQQPYAFDGLHIHRLVRDIPEFNEGHPLPFRDTDDGAGAEGWTFFEFREEFREKNEFDKNLWWKFNKNGEIIGFESEGRKMFLGIAEIVISFHEKKMFSGNLVSRIRILPDLNVTHKSSPQIDEQAFADGGQRSDIHHFRWMVAAMVTTAFPNIYSTRCKMSSKFLLFFSEIFTDQEGLKYYFVSQLYHPIFFNSSDRCNLIRMMRDLYNINPVAFKSNGFALPLYIRNLHEHFSERKYFSQSHEHIDSEIDNLFPGVAAAIIDSTIRNLHGNWDLFRSTTTTTLPYLQRTSPYGWCFPFYR
ncbi:uncharacterized protein LOC136065144 isoform X2 [Quercus suber]